MISSCRNKSFGGLLASYHYSQPQLSYIANVRLCGTVFVYSHWGSVVGVYNGKQYITVEIKPVEAWDSTSKHWASSRRRKTHNFFSIRISYLRNLRRKLLWLHVCEEMIGHYLGEFSITYKPIKHGRAGMMSKNSQFVPLKWVDSWMVARKGRSEKKQPGMGIQELWDLTVIVHKWVRPVIIIIIIIIIKGTFETIRSSVIESVSCLVLSSLSSYIAKLAWLNTNRSRTWRTIWLTCTRLAVCMIAAQETSTYPADHTNKTMAEGEAGWNFWPWVVESEDYETRKLSTFNFVFGGKDYFGIQADSSKAWVIRVHDVLLKAPKKRTFKKYSYRSSLRVYEIVWCSNKHCGCTYLSFQNRCHLDCLGNIYIYTHSLSNSGLLRSCEVVLILTSSWIWATRTMLPRWPLKW